jgi:hypothetical protein
MPIIQHKELLQIIGYGYTCIQKQESIYTNSITTKVRYLLFTDFWKIYGRFRSNHLFRDLMNTIRLINEVEDCKKPKWYNTLTFMITPTIVRTTNAHPRRTLKVKLIEINSKPLFPKEHDEIHQERDGHGRKLISIRQTCLCPNHSEGHNGGGQTSLRALAHILNPYAQDEKPIQLSDSEDSEIPDPYSSSDELPELE